MRPLSLKIIATALLGGGVVWVFSQSFWQDSGSDKPITSERGTQPARHRELPASPAILPL